MDIFCCHLKICAVNVQSRGIPARHLLALKPKHCSAAANIVAKAPFLSSNLDNVHSTSNIPIFKHFFRVLLKANCKNELM